LAEFPETQFLFGPVRHLPRKAARPNRTGFMPRAWRQAPDTGFFIIHPMAAEHLRRPSSERYSMTVLDLLPISFIVLTYSIYTHQQHCRPAGRLEHRNAIYFLSIGLGTE